MAQLVEAKFKTKNGSTVTLRSPKVGEGAQLLGTVQRILSSSDHLLTQIEEFKFTAEQEDEMIAEYSSHPNKILIVPEIDNKVVGMMNFNCGGKLRNAHTGEFGMSLLPECRGQGIGTKMLEALIEWAKANPKIEKVILRVHGNNLPAISLYKKNGFEIEGREIKGIKLADGKYDDVLCMSRFV